jgi:uncharacterized protein (DUF983 family)
MKKCPDCGKGPDEVEFYTNVRPTSKCKGCVRKYNRSRYAPDTVKPGADAAATLAGLMGAKLS